MHDRHSFDVADDLSGVKPLDGPNNNSTNQLSNFSSAQSSTTKAEISTLAQYLQQSQKDLGHSGVGSTPGSELNNDAADDESGELT